MPLAGKSGSAGDALLEHSLAKCSKKAARSIQAAFLEQYEVVTLVHLPYEKTQPDQKVRQCF